MFRTYASGVNEARASVQMSKAMAELDVTKRRRMLAKIRDEHAERATKYKARAGGVGGKKFLRMAAAEEGQAEKADREIRRLDKRTGRDGAPVPRASDAEVDPRARLETLDRENAGRLSKKERQVYERRRAALLRQIERAERSGQAS